MSTFKKVLASTAAFAALISLAAPANAAITVGGVQNFISSTTAPSASTVFSTGATITVNNTAPVGGGTAAVLAAGNIVTVSLPAGVIFATEPTFTPTNVGTAVFSKVSGGNGTGFFSFSVGAGTVDAAANIMLTNVNIQGLPSAVNGATVRATLSDQAGLVLPTTATDVSPSVANFRNLYTVRAVGQGSAGLAASFTAGTTTSATDFVNNLISISGTSPGTTFTVGSASTTTNARLGDIFLDKNTGIVNWGGAAVTAGAATFNVTLPAGTPPFTTPTATLTGCGAGATVSAFTGSTYTVTVPAANLAAVAGGASCQVSLAAPLVTSNAAFISRGGVTFTGTLANTNGPASSTPQTIAGTLAGFDYTGGTPHVLGYVNGSDASYQTFVSVSTAASAGPIIVNANVGGSAGSAVVTTSQIANSNVLYPIASGANSVRDALITAGMSSSIFNNGASRGQLTVIAPTGARVTLLLLSPNGTVTEVGRSIVNN